jgi:hypothetical protein
MSTGRVAVQTANSTTYVPLISLQGTNGTLTAIGVASGANYHDFQITIDGLLVVSDLFTGSNATVVAANSGLGVSLPFASSLLVEIRDRPKPSSLTKFWACYVTGHTEQIGDSELRVEEFDNQPFLIRHAEYGDEEVRYSVETLEGPLRWSRVDLDTDYYLTDDTIEGTLTAWEGPEQYPLILDEVDLIVRPHGFTRVLDRFPMGPSDNPRRFSYRSVHPAVRDGTFEIVADLPGVANIPGIFFKA